MYVQPSDSVTASMGRRYYRGPGLGLCAGLVFALAACEGGQPPSTQMPVASEMRGADMDEPVLKAGEAVGQNPIAVQGKLEVASPTPGFQDADDPARNAREWRAAQLGAGALPQEAAVETTDQDDAEQATAEITMQARSAFRQKNPAASRAKPVHASELPAGREGITEPRRDVRRVDLAPSSRVPVALDQYGRLLGASPQSAPRVPHRNLPAQPEFSNIDAQGRARLR